MILRPIIETPKYDLSVQASKYHYCTPREDLKDINSYITVEVALFNKTGNWVQPREEEILQQFPEITDLLEHWEDCDTNFIGQVPIKLVNRFITYLNNLQ